MLPNGLRAGRNPPAGICCPHRPAARVRRATACARTSERIAIDRGGGRAVPPTPRKLRGSAQFDPIIQRCHRPEDRIQLRFRRSVLYKHHSLRWVGISTLHLTGRFAHTLWTPVNRNPSARHVRMAGVSRRGSCCDRSRVERPSFPGLSPAPAWTHLPRGAYRGLAPPISRHAACGGPLHG